MTAVPNFAAILSGMPQPYLVLDGNLAIVGASDSYLALTSRTREDIVGRHILEAFPENPDAPGTVEQGPLEVSLKHVLQTRKAHEMAVIQYDIPRLGGGFSQKFWMPIHTPVLDDTGAVSFIIQNPMDVTESVLRNREADARLRVALHAADLATWEYEPETDIWRRSQIVDQMFGFAVGEAGPVAAPFFARMHPDDLVQIRANLAAVAGSPDQTAFVFDYRIVLPDGAVRHIASRGEILRTAGGKVRMIGVLMDVTADRVRQAELEEALKAQERLLAELNHRVKNSLQLVVSTLRLQARRLHFPVTAAAFDEAISRVRAIISVHERLYRTGNALSVDMATHLHKLCLDIVGADHEGRVTVDAEEVELTPERAIPVSVIINEILTAALSRAETLDEYEVQIMRRRDNGLDLSITVRGGKKPIVLTDLSRRLIGSMVAQVGGEFDDSQHDDRYRAVLTFPREA